MSDLAPELKIRKLETVAREAILDGFDWITDDIEAHDLLWVCQEARRLQQALINYGEHGRGPDHRPCPKEFEPQAVCTCGLDEAWGDGNGN